MKQGAWVPILALLVLLGTGVQGLVTTEALTEQAMVSPELQRQLGDMLGRGEPHGYVPLLRQYLRDDVLGLQVVTLGGEVLAQWPAPLTEQRWGVFAPLFEELRLLGVGLLSRQHEVPLAYQGHRVGTLIQLGLRGVYGVRPVSLLHGLMVMLAGLGLWFQFGLMMQPRRAPPMLGKPVRASLPRTERVSARFGDVLDQTSVGLMLVNVEQKLRYLNQAACAYVGKPRSEVLNQSVYSVLRPDPASASSLKLGHDAPRVQELKVKLLGDAHSATHVQLTALRLEGDGGMLIWLRSLEDELGVEASLRWEARLAQVTLDSLSDGLVVTDKYGRIKRVNQCLNRLFSYAEGELEGVAISKLLPVPFLNEPSVSLRTYIGPRQEGRPRVVGWRKNATTFPVELKVTELDSDEHAYLLLINDCGDRLRQDNLSMRLGRLLDYAAEEIYIFDAHSLYITEANREARDNLGYDLDQLSRMTPLHLAPGLDRQDFERDLSALRNGDQRQVVLRTEHRRADQSVYPVSLRLSYSGEEEPPVFMALAQDITEQREAEQKLEFLAHHDPLTGAPNRAALSAHLQHLLDVSGERGRVAILFLDLDDFKQINDTHGHAIGDEVLLEFATRLKGSLDEAYFMARLSGDEFIVAGLCQSTEALRQLAQRILDAMQAPVQLPGLTLRLSVSIGIARADEHDSIRDLVHRADQAMYRAKSAGSRFYLDEPEVALSR